MTLNDNNIRDGDVLLLTATEPSAPEWVVCDPSHALARRGSAGGGPTLRMVPAICCVLLCAVGAATLAWSAARTAVGRPHRHRHMCCRRRGGWRGRGSAPPLPERSAESDRRVLRRGSRFPGGATRPTRNRSAARIRRRVLRGDPHAAPDWLRPNMFDGDCDRERADRGRRNRGGDVEAAAERGRRSTCHDLAGHAGSRTQAVDGAQRHQPVDAGYRRHGRCDA